MAYEYNYIIFYHKDIVLLFISQKKPPHVFRNDGGINANWSVRFFLSSKATLIDIHQTYH